MGWAKLDDRYAFHPKLMGDLEARGLDAAAISYCAGQETDGFVSNAIVVALAAGAKSPMAVAERLVSRGRWTKAEGGGGFWVKDYLAYNPSKSELEERRKADRRRKDSGRKPPGNPSGSHSGNQPDAEQNPSGSRADSASRPGARAQAHDPSRPDRDKSSSEDLGVAPAAAEEEEDRSSTATETPEAQVARLVAERRLAKRQGEPIRNRARWLRSVAAEVTDEFRTVIRLSLATNTPEQIAASIEPDEPAVERRPCCGTPVGEQPHRFDCPAEAELRDAAERAAVGG